MYSAPRRNNGRRAILINYLSANYCNYMLPHPRARTLSIVVAPPPPPSLTISYFRRRKGRVRDEAAIISFPQSHDNWNDNSRFHIGPFFFFSFSYFSSAFNVAAHLGMYEPTIGSGITDNLPVFAGLAKLPRRAPRTARNMTADRSG